MEPADLQHHLRGQLKYPPQKSSFPATPRGKRSLVATRAKVLSTHGGLEVLVCVDGRRKCLSSGATVGEEGVPLLLLRSLMGVGVDRLLRKAMLVGHTLISSPGLGSGVDAVFSVRMQRQVLREWALGPRGCCAPTVRVVETGRPVVDLIVLEQSTGCYHPPTGLLRALMVCLE